MRNYEKVNCDTCKCDKEQIKFWCQLWKEVYFNKKIKRVLANENLMGSGCLNSYW